MYPQVVVFYRQRINCTRTSGFLIVKWRRATDHDVLVHTRNKSFKLFPDLLDHLQGAGIVVLLPGVVLKINHVLNFQKLNQHF